MMFQDKILVRTFINEREAGDMTRSFQILAVRPYYEDDHTKEEVEMGKRVVEICGMSCRVEKFIPSSGLKAWKGKDLSEDLRVDGRITLK
jgi:hypothetical protein